MPSAKKDTQRKTPTERKKTPKELRPAFSKAVGKRLQQAMDAQNSPCTSEALAKRLGERWGQDKPVYTRVNGWLSGTGNFTALSLRDLSHELGVSADWLLFGEGPMWRADRRPTAEWLDDFAGHIHREVYARLHPKEPTDVDKAFIPLRPEHIEVRGDAILRRVVDDLAMRFGAYLDTKLGEGSRVRSVESQAEVIKALVAALPLSAADRAIAATATSVVDVDSAIQVPDPEFEELRLSSAGYDALRPAWELEAAPDAWRDLVELARRTTRTREEAPQPQTPEKRPPRQR